MTTTTVTQGIEEYETDFTFGETLSVTGAITGKTNVVTITTATYAVTVAQHSQVQDRLIQVRQQICIQVLL